MDKWTSIPKHLLKQAILNVNNTIASFTEILTNNDFQNL